MKKNDTNPVHIITLSRGLETKVSYLDRDLTEVKKYKYSAVSNGYKIYAVRSEAGNNKKKIYLAREIMQRILGDDFPLIKGDIVIHLDGDPLNNTRANLDCPKANNRKTIEQ